MEQTAMIMDLSHNNPYLDHAKVQEEFQKFKDNGGKLVFLKVSQGCTFADPAKSVFASIAREVGLYLGFYAFLDNSDSQAQMEFFLSLIQGAGECLIALDKETNPATGTEPLKAVVVNAGNYLTSKGLNYGLYGNLFDLSIGLCASDFVSGRMPYLWEAKYSLQKPTVPEGWESFSLWQFSEYYNLDGVQVDMSTLNTDLYGSFEEFYNMFKVNLS